MNRRSFLNRILLSAAFLGLSRFLPGSQTEFVELTFTMPDAPTPQVRLADLDQVMRKVMAEYRHYYESESVSYKYIVNQRERWLYEDGRGQR